jgi:hypothetical protein
MNSLKAKIEVLRVAVSAAPPSTPPRCKAIIEKWANIRAKINQAYEAGVSQVNGLTLNTLGNVWEFEIWNSQNGNPFPPEMFKFSVGQGLYVTTNRYPPAAAMQQPQLSTPSTQNDPNLAKEQRLQCIKALRKCALLRGYKDSQSGKYIRGKFDLMYSADVLEAIELATKGCEPYASAGGNRNATTSDKRNFFQEQIRGIESEFRSNVNDTPVCKSCTQQRSAQTAPAGEQR